MKKIGCIIILLLGHFIAFGQQSDFRDFTETKIEGGATYTKLKNGKLDSVVVGMFAVNYGNALIFSRSSEAIMTQNANDDQAVIKIEIKNKKQVKTLWYDNSLIVSMEYFDFDLQNLPKNRSVSIFLENDLVTASAVDSKLEQFTGELDDKTMKVFFGLNIPANLTQIDAVFNYIGDFFTQENALLKIFYGEYAQEFQPSMIASFETDQYGKIREGIILDYQKNVLKNQYKIYRNGKVIKTDIKGIIPFQKIFREYLIRDLN